MTTMTATRDRLAELTKDLAQTLLEARYAASVYSAHMRAAKDSAKFRPLINGSAIKAADKPTPGTKPCK